MKTALQIFDFGDSAVRTYVITDRVWFVAADVCRVLDIQNPRDAVASLESDEKITVSNTDGNSGVGGMTVANTDGHSSRGGARSFNLISESGLYSLIFRSRKPEAKVFRKWVTNEVLPALRKSGRYEIAEPTSRDEAGWDLDSIFTLGRQAAERLLDGSLQPQAAATVATLIEECRKSYELRWRIVPPAMVAPSRDSEMADLLAAMAGQFAADSEFRMPDLVALAKSTGLVDGELTPSLAKSFGRRLQTWAGRSLTDVAGRAFTLGRRRSKAGAVYFIRFEKNSSDAL